MSDRNPPLLPHSPNIINEIIGIGLIVNFHRFTVNGSCVAPDDFAGRIGRRLAHPVRYGPRASVELLNAILHRLTHRPDLIKIEELFPGTRRVFDHYRIFIRCAKKVGWTSVVIGDWLIPGRIIPHEILYGHQSTWSVFGFDRPDAVGIAIRIAVFRFYFVTILTGRSSQGNSIPFDIEARIADICKQTCQRVKPWAGCCGVCSGKAPVIADDNTDNVVACAFFFTEGKIQ
ncbi:hypothetical protein D3C81_493030 [compost metagenome]